MICFVYFRRQLRNHDLDDLFDDDALLNSLLRWVYRTRKLLLRYFDSLLHQLIGRGDLFRNHVCRRTCVLDSLERASWQMRFALWAVGAGPPTASPLFGPQCTVGVLAGTHWSALRCPGRMASGAERQPLWLCFVGGGGHVMRTSCTRVVVAHPDHHESDGERQLSHDET